MPDEENTRRLDPERDAAALKALTHPLRIKLLGLLRLDGPATATELAGRTGESSASASYHLRVLAKHDFVGEAEGRDSRERRWRAVHSGTAWENAAVGASDSREFLSVVRRVQIEAMEQVLVQHEQDLAAGRLAQEWLEPSGISDMITALTPESLTELKEAVHRKLEELEARDEGDPRAEKAMVFLAGLPLAAREQGSDS